MTYLGYFRQGDTEVANHARLAEYLANGLMPSGWEDTDCLTACGDLAEAVGQPTGGYTSPLVDGAPWVDPDNPDSADFAGIMMVDVGNLDGSTITVNVEESAGDGGVPGTPRAASRVIPVTAALLARSAGGAQAGLAWLSSLLHPPCAAGDCGGDSLHLFTTCPATCYGQTDPNAAPVAYNLLDGNLFGITATPGSSFTVPAGTTLISPRSAVCDDVTVSVTFTGTGTVRLVTTDTVGEIVETTAATTATGSPTTLTITTNASPGFPDTWRFGLVTTAAVTVTAVTLTHRPILSVEECVAPLRRTFNNVTTVAGPTVVRRDTDADGEQAVLIVEWTWVATDPHPYADPVPLLTGVPSAGGSAAYAAPTVVLGSTSTVTAASTACALPAPSLLSCADRPGACCPPLAVTPPAAPTIVDPCLMVPSNYTRRAAQLPPEVMPAGLGVLRWRFVNDASPKLGVRVRLWEDPTPDFGSVSECAFVEEFTIDWLAAGETLLIDGSTGEVIVTCPTAVEGVKQWVDTSRNVRGSYGGAFLHPVVGCNRRYHVTVDVPQTYTATCTGVYTSGNPQGSLTWGVDLIRRDL